MVAAGDDIRQRTSEGETKPLGEGLSAAARKNERRLGCSTLLADEASSSKCTREKERVL